MPVFDCKFADSFFKVLAQGPDLYRKLNMHSLSNLHNHQLTQLIRNVLKDKLPVKVPNEP